MPMTATARFALSDDDLHALFALAGRSDTAAYGLADDLESSLGGYLVVARGGGAGLPPAVDADLAGIAGQAAQLRSALYALPADVALLLDLHVLGEGAKRRIARDLEAVTAPLEDLVAVIAEVRAQAQATLGASGEALDRRVLAAIAAAYRNRLNLRPSADPDGHFGRFAKGVLRLAGGHAEELRALARRTGPAQLATAIEDLAARGRPLGAPLLRE
jgi:hypothetical protein